MQPATNTTIAGALSVAYSKYYFAYIGSDQRLYLYVGAQDAGFLPTDLFNLWQVETGIIPPFPRTGTGMRSGGPITMNSRADSNQYDNTYLCYIDVNSHIQALNCPVYNWEGNQYGVGLPPGATNAEAINPDLTSRTGAPQAAADSSLASYGWQSQKSQHVVYVGTDGNVWELYQLWEQFDGVRGGLLWQANNLSERTGYVGELAPRENSPLAGTTFETEGSEHIIYMAKDNTIRELWFYNGGWGGNNLTEATGGAVAPAANSSLTVYAAEYEDTLHVAYLGEDGNIHELWWNRNGWQPHHAISEIVSIKPASGTAIIGYATEYERTHHVVYINENNELQELYHNSGGWNTTWLSASAGSGATPPINSSSPLAGYSVESMKGQHIYYLDDQTRVHEIYRKGDSWYAGEVAS
jgi:Fungal fucose-specific lectin